MMNDISKKKRIFLIPEDAVLVLQALVCLRFHHLDGEACLSVQQQKKHVKNWKCWLLLKANLVFCVFWYETKVHSKCGSTYFYGGQDTSFQI